MAAAAPLADRVAIRGRLGDDVGRVRAVRRRHAGRRTADARADRAGLVEDTVAWGPSGHEEWEEQAKVPVKLIFE